MKKLTMRRIFIGGPGEYFDVHASIHKLLLDRFRPGMRGVEGCPLCLWYRYSVLDDNSCSNCPAFYHDSPKVEALLKKIGIIPAEEVPCMKRVQVWLGKEPRAFFSGTLKAMSKIGTRDTTLDKEANDQLDRIYQAINDAEEIIENGSP